MNVRAVCGNYASYKSKQKHSRLKIFHGATFWISSCVCPPLKFLSAIHCKSRIAFYFWKNITRKSFNECPPIAALRYELWVISCLFWLFNHYWTQTPWSVSSSLWPLHTNCYNLFSVSESLVLHQGTISLHVIDDFLILVSACIDIEKRI